MISDILAPIINNFALKYSPTPQVPTLPPILVGAQNLSLQSGPNQIVVYPNKDRFGGPEQHFVAPLQARGLRDPWTRIDWSIWAPAPPLTPWAALATYAGAGGLVVPSPANTDGLYFTGTAGATGTIEPPWPDVVGGIVVDGTVTWTCTGSVSSYTLYQFDAAYQIRGWIVQAIHAAAVGSYHLLGGEWYKKSDQLVMDGMWYTLSTEFRTVITDTPEGTAVIRSVPIAAKLET